VCVYETGLLLLFARMLYRTSAASVELRPRGWRAVAFPCWHHYQSGSTWLIVILIVRCCFGGLCTRQACYLFARVALVLLPLSLFLGVHALSRFPSVALPLGSKLLGVAHCSLLHQLFLLCFGFIVALIVIV